jgi:uncharacterized membrane protein YhaH (DUF805 family)
MKYLIRGFNHYVDFNGRDTRKEFWMYELFNYIFGTFFYILSLFSHGLIILYFLWVLAAALPTIAIMVRRLHDIGKSGWWILIVFIPIVGPIVLIVFLATPGNAESNKYGDARNTTT